MPAGLVVPPQPRDFHGVNWTGAWTLYLKEVKRFWKVGMQTLAAPVLNALLYLLIFSVGINRPAVNGIPYAVFIAPGLIMMSILNAAFANSSSSLMQAKMMGLAQDFLTAPLTPTEQVCAFALGAATRGVVVGLVTAIAIWPLVHFSVAHWWAIFYFGLMASLMMGMIGMVAGLWAEKFDHLAAVTTPTTMPRVAAPRAKAQTCSVGDRGAVRKSCARPIILACISEDEELAKAAFRIDIMIRPGAMKTA